MSDGFDAMIAEGRGFFAELARNNDRAWFEPRKPWFKTVIEGPTHLLAILFAEDLARLTGRAHAGKVGRIYRDTRFSADKSPFNPYLHAYWTPSGGTGPGWLFRITADGAQMMTGLHDLDTPGLAQFRAAVDRDGPGLTAALQAARAGGGDLLDFGAEALKRVPKPYAPDHPMGDILRRKGLAVGLTLTDLDDGLLPAMNRAARAFLPFWRWCDAVRG